MIILTTTTVKITIAKVKLLVKMYEFHGGIFEKDINKKVLLFTGVLNLTPFMKNSIHIFEEKM